MRVLRVLWMKTPCGYNLANRPHGAPHTGVRSDLVQQVWQQRKDPVDRSTKQYGVHRRFRYEVHGSNETAIGRENALKKRYPASKTGLIEKANPLWSDRYDEIRVGSADGLDGDGFLHSYLSIQTYPSGQTYPSVQSYSSGQSYLSVQMKLPSQPYLPGQTYPPGQLYLSGQTYRSSQLYRCGQSYLTGQEVGQHLQFTHDLPTLIPVAANYDI